MRANPSLGKKSPYQKSGFLNFLISAGLVGTTILLFGDDIVDRVSQDEWFTGPIDPFSQPYEDAPQQRIESTTENTLPSGAQVTIEVQSDWIITLPEGSKLEVIELGEMKDGYRWALVRHTADDGSITEGWVAYADELGQNPWLTTFDVR